MRKNSRDTTSQIEQRIKVGHLQESRGESREPDGHESWTYMEMILSRVKSAFFFFKLALSLVMMIRAYQPRPNFTSKIPLRKRTGREKEDMMARELKQRIHDLQHQIDLLPTDHFYSSKTLTQHEHLQLLLSAHRNETLYYMEQLEIVRHQLDLVNEQHVSAATAMTQLAADNVVLRQRLKQRQDRDRAGPASKKTKTTLREDKNVCVAESCLMDDQQCLEQRQSVTRWSFRSGDKDMKRTISDLESETNRLRKLVLILMRLLLHR